MKRTLLGQTSACFRTDRQAKELPGMYKMGVIGVTSLSYLIMLWWWEGVLAHTHWTAERIAGGHNMDCVKDFTFSEVCSGGS